MTQPKSELEKLKELQKESQKLRDRQESPSAASQEAASEHPALALLAAFGIGIFVGQLLSRR